MHRLRLRSNLNNPRPRRRDGLSRERAGARVRKITLVLYLPRRRAPSPGRAPGVVNTAGQLLFVTFLSIWQFVGDAKLYFQLTMKKRPGQIQGAVFVQPL